MGTFQQKTRRYYTENGEKTSFSTNAISSDKRFHGKRPATENKQHPKFKFLRNDDGNKSKQTRFHDNNSKLDQYGYVDEEDEDVTEDKEAGHKLDSSKKKAKEYHKDAKLKQFRLIVRNLPFKTTKVDLQNVCSNFGPFTEIVLPSSKKMEGKCAGFCFIQFKTQEIAEKAKEHFNSNKILGRMVAADWALDKDTYETSAHEEKQALKTKVKEEKEGNTTEVANLNEAEINSEDESELDKKEYEEENDINDKKQKKKSKTDTAIDEGRVVFLRNLSFDTTEETLKDAMKTFGTAQLTIICKFKDSGHSKGTAFVHFSTKEEATFCVSSGENGDLIIDNRNINAMIAIPREKVEEIEKESNKKIPSDNRNLRLLRFSLIREGTSAAGGMSSEDAKKRVKLAEDTKKKLENLHMFVSPLRLVIHNIPLNLTDSKLREICKNAGGPGAFITECKIWKDMERLNSKGQPKSKGFGFVAFKEHTHALNCLQKLNNNPNTFTNEKRPIIEFSIENLVALQAKERRTVRSKGEDINPKQMNEKIRKQVQESIGKIHLSGMKFLPKFLGTKMRHRNMSKNKKKKLGLLKKDKNSEQPELKKRKSGKKTLTKYLALSS